MARFLDVDAFADGIVALQTEIRGERRIPSIVADGYCATLGSVLRQVRADLQAPAHQRVDRNLDETARQAMMMGGFDRGMFITRPFIVGEVPCEQVVRRGT